MQPVSRRRGEGVLDPAVLDALHGGAQTDDFLASGCEARFDFLGLEQPADVAALVCAALLAAVPDGLDGVAAAGHLALADRDPGLNPGELQAPLQVVRRAVAVGDGLVDGGRDDGLGRQDAAAGPHLALGLGQLELGALAPAGALDVHLRPLGQREAEVFLQVLRRHLGREGVIHAVPDRGVEADPAGDDVDVLELRVAVDDRDELVLGGVEADLAHQAVADAAPGLGVEVLPGREGQGTVPDRPLALRPQPTRRAELGRELLRRPAGHVAADDLAGVAAVEGVVQEAAESAAALDVGLHRTGASYDGALLVAVVLSRTLRKGTASRTW